MGSSHSQVDLTGLTQAIESASAALMVTGTDNRVTYLNEATRRIFLEHEVELRRHFPRFSARQVVGTNLDLFLDKTVGPSINVRDVSQLPQTFCIRVGALQFELTISSFCDDEGKPTGRVIEWKEVTEQVRLEAERTRTMTELAAFKQAADAASVALMLCDADFNITYANEETLRILSRRERALKKSFPDFSAASVVGSNMDRFHKNPGHQRRLLLDPKNSPYRGRLSAGPVRFEINSSMVRGDGGRAEGFILEWRDVTDQVAAESSIERLIDAASRGSLQERFTLDDQDGFIRTVGERVNTLLEAMARPLNEVRRVTEAIAAGRLTESIDEAYEGEFGAVVDSLNRSTSNLQQVVGRISNACAEIARVGSEISAGNSDLNNRTQQQAAALEETASTVEELTATVKKNAENARNADKLASDARDVAFTGGEVVKQAVEAMSEIDTSSQRIADIIGVIDEIAFQTNLLALNAAVEAARAGDQGRGFAVVATEVRNLAQRSANAAREIKVLIKDSLDKVEDGTRLVNRSGSTLENIMSGVKKVSDIVAEIAAASDEQATSIDQVNQAIAQMDETTQQNAALVEQATASAIAMNDQTAGLDELVRAFQISGSTGAEAQNAESDDAEPTYAASAYEEPAYEEPAYEEPAYTENTTHAEPTYAEPAYSESAPEPVVQYQSEASADPISEEVLAKTVAPPAPTRSEFTPVYTAGEADDEWEEF